MKRFTTTVTNDLNQVTNVTRQQAQAAIQLQRQRSAALIQEWKKEQRESQQTEAAKLRDFQRSITEIARAEQRRTAETVRAANQRLREEQRAAREVARINAETARQAANQERLRERAAKQLADVQIREAKRAARELERSLAAGGGGGGGDSLAIFGAAVGGRIPALTGLTSQLGAVSAASAGAGAATASLAGPIGIAVAALLAEAAAAAAVTKGLFDLAKQTAAFQGNLFDMSQQVGISVETLSTLEVLAKTTGGSIETVAASMALFQRNLEEAHDPTSKEGKLLAELGVTATDTEEALQQTLAGLFALGEGSKQTDAALQLFGRSGRFINAILKESQGDLEKAKQRFQELGIVVSGQSAKAADEFNDNLALLEFQIRGLTAYLGNQVIPFALEVIEDLRKGLKDNKDVVEALGIVFRTTAQFIAAHFTGAIKLADGFIKNHKTEILLLKEAYENLAAAMQLVSGSVPQIDPNAIPALPLVEGSRSPAETLKWLQELQKTFLETTKRPDIKDALKDYFAELDKAEREAQQQQENAKRRLEQQLQVIEQLNIEYKRLSDSLRGIDVSTRAYAVSESVLTGVLKDASAELIKQAEAIAKSTDNRAKQLELQNRLKEFLEQQEEAVRTAIEGERTHAEATNEFVKALEREGAVLQDVTKFWLNFNATILDSKDRLKILIEMMRESAELVPRPGGELPERSAGFVFDDSSLGLPPPPEEFSLWEHAVMRLQDVMQSFSDFTQTTFVGAFESVAGALASGVEAWALYGESFGKAMKQALAASAARVAGEATFQGALHAAYALGSLALLDFRGAAQHAIAAAKFFAVAALAGIGARAIAGNTFQQGAGGGAGSGSGGSSGSTRPGSGQRDPIDLTRPREVVHRWIFHVESNDSHILRVFQDDVRRNGSARQIIKEVTES